MTDTPTHHDFTLILPDGTEQGVSIEATDANSGNFIDRDAARDRISDLYAGYTIAPDPEPQEGTNS